jgi:hypothetical protein
MARRRISLAIRRNRTESRQSTIVGGKKGLAAVMPPIVETDFTQLQDGSIVEMTQDPEDASRSVFALFKNGNVCFTPRVESQGQILVPLARDSEIVRNVRLASGVEPYGSVRSLLSQLTLVFDQYLDLEKGYSFLLANFVLSSWLVDQLPVAPYLAVVGLPGSGKTTLLKILRLLCRRSILTADITSAALYRVCDRLTPTVLIDETNTAGHRSTLFHLLRVGFTPGVPVFRMNQSFKVYGAKAVSWMELPNDSALNSRCVKIPLQETERRDLKRITDPEFQDLADHVQKQLLQYRFDRLNSLALPLVASADRLHGRTRDLYEALALANGDPESCEKLSRIFEILQEQDREPLPTRDTAVLRTLFLLVHTVECRHLGWMIIGDLAGFVNRWLESRRETFRLSPKEVGSVLTLLGMTDRRRSLSGWRVGLDRRAIKRIHDLVYRFGLDGSRDDPDPLESSSKYRLMIAPTAYKSCEFCQALEAPKEEQPRGEYGAEPLPESIEERVI